MGNGAERLSLKKWGVFNHFLYNNVCNCENSHNMETGITDWNAAVNCFDVEKLAYRLHKMNVGYYFITMMQGSKHMLAPNSAYDRIAGTNPGEACALRDLPMDLSDALRKYNIDLCLYYTGDGPHNDEVIGGRFGFNGDAWDGVSKVDRNFCENWAKVLEEYAQRYGDRVSAWWIDGCYREQLGYTDEYMKLYFDAVKAGNPDVAVGFNNGITHKRLTKTYIDEDFVAGEYNDFLIRPAGKYIDGALAHILAPLGYGKKAYEDGHDDWCSNGIKHPRDYMLDYIQGFNRKGGAVTVDIMVNIDGSFDPEQEALLRWVGEKL